MCPLLVTGYRLPVTELRTTNYELDMDPRRRRGNKGERLACAYLRRRGYTILHAPWRALPYGEIDIVARHGAVLVFIEVKTRRTHEFGYPEESVTPRKREKISRLIDLYFETHRLPMEAHRFDVIAIELGDGAPRITHLEAVEV